MMRWSLRLRPPMVKPGEAAARILESRKKAALKKKKKKYPVSENIREYLYVAEDNS